MRSTLDTLLEKGLIWRGRDGTAPPALTVSGLAQLDEQLGGLPGAGVIDIQSPTGIGELRLLLPYLAQREAGQHSGRLSVFIAPPARVNAESLAGAGLTLGRVLLLNPETAHQALWAAEQCLKSGCCRAVLLWQKSIKIHQAQRLQLAAQEGRASLWLLRTKPASYALPVSLSMALSAHPQGLQVSVPRRRGAWPIPTFTLDMRTDWPELTLAGSPAKVVPRPRAQTG